MPLKKTKQANKQTKELVYDVNLVKDNKNNKTVTELQPK